MEWMNRGVRPSAPTQGQPAVTGIPAPIQQQPNAARPSRRRLNVIGVSTIALTFSVAILLIVLSFSFAFGRSGNSQDDYVDTGKMQAVFLNGGQVYFGKITDINSQYVKMANIYYLRVNQTVQPNGSANTTNTASNQDISLVKLGCELHGPQDSMVINQSQVIFWENLKSDGQVAKAVDDYVKQNPNGQQCDTSSTGTNNTTGTSQNTNE